MAVGALNVEANPRPLAVVDRVLVLHVLHEIPPSLPVAVVVATVHLQGSSEVVGGLTAGGTHRRGIRREGSAQIYQVSGMVAGNLQVFGLPAPGERPKRKVVESTMSRLPRTRYIPKNFFAVPT